LGIGQGDAVFCPAFTFFASAEAIAAVGATPVFVDVDERTFNVSVSSLEHSLLKIRAQGQYRPVAVMAVDLFGLPADYDALEPLCDKEGLLLIEDGAQGFGGSIGSRRACSFGHVATTSFFPAKPLGCYGDGGAVFTNSDEVAERIRSLRVHGKGKDKYDNVRIGMNSRLDTMQAAILLEKLDVFPEELEKRNKAAAFYTELLGSEVRIPWVPGGCVSSWAQYTVVVGDRRDAVQSSMQSARVPTAVYYAKCLHKQTAFSTLTAPLPELPVSEQLSRHVLSLPMHPYLEESDQYAVVDALKKALGK
jgi:dTDP-4-amino-4,6-dideoxygalactose transaminase